MSADSSLAFLGRPRLRLSLRSESITGVKWLGLAALDPNFAPLQSQNFI